MLLPIISSLCCTIVKSNSCLLRPSLHHSAGLALLASLSALASSFLGADPFLHHPARPKTKPILSLW